MVSILVRNPHIVYDGNLLNKVRLESPFMKDVFPEQNNHCNLRHGNETNIMLEGREMQLYVMQNIYTKCMLCHHAVFFIIILISTIVNNFYFYFAYYLKK